MNLTERIFKLLSRVVIMAFESIMRAYNLDSSMFGAFFNGALWPILALTAILAFIIGLAFYIYFALAWSTIAGKLKYKKSWLAWIPIANISMILQLGGFHWAWVFLILIPVVGWIALLVLGVIATWRIFERRHYPGWFSISLVIPKVGIILYLVAIGFVAWKNKK